MPEGNIVILAGGISSRMRSSSATTIDEQLRHDAETKSKSMIRIGNGNRPFLDVLLQNVHNAGYNDIVIVVNENDTSVRRYYESAKRLSISFATQMIPPGRTKPLGTSDALLQALVSKPEWRGHHFTVCNSDNLYSVRALKMLLGIDDGNALIDYDRSALGFDRERIEQFAVLYKRADGALLDILEKPSADQVTKAQDANGRIGVGMNIFRFAYADIFPILQIVPMHPVRKEQELPEAVRIMITQFPAAMKALPLAEHVPDLTSQDDILHVKEFLKEMDSNVF